MCDNNNRCRWLEQLLCAHLRRLSPVWDEKQEEGYWRVFWGGEFSPRSCPFAVFSCVLLLLLGWVSFYVRVHCSELIKWFHHLRRARNVEVEVLQRPRCPGPAGAQGRHVSRVQAVHVLGGRDGSQDHLFIDLRTGSDTRAVEYRMHSSG